MTRSHLQRHLRKQSLRNSILGIGGMIILLIVLFSFGPDLLILFSSLLKNSDQTAQGVKTEVAYIAPPVINPLPPATNSATIIVSGTATNAEIIKVSINGKVVDKTTVKKNNTFRFSSIPLEKGKNTITAKALIKNQESNHSSPVMIRYLDKQPTLEISFPSDGQTVNSSPITITGKTDTSAKVTINDFWAISEADGTFSYRYNVQSGENKLKIIATDEAENKTEKEITVKRE